MRRNRMREGNRGLSLNRMGWAFCGCYMPGHVRVTQDGSGSSVGIGHTSYCIAGSEREENGGLGDGNPKVARPKRREVAPRFSSIRRWMLILVIWSGFYNTKVSADL